MPVAFQLYGPDHILTLVFLAGVTILLIRLLHRAPSSHRHPKLAIHTLAFLCFASYPVNLLSIFIQGSTPNLGDMLPLHLCNLTALFCGWALLTRHPLLCELSYFWGLAGTMQGLLTPDINYDFPDPLYLSFFLQHGSIVITALILPLGLGWIPRPKAARRAYGWLLVYAVSIFGINSALGTNYGFIMAKPEGASLLDVLGDWPWYIFWTLLIAAGLFFLLELPFKKHRSKPI
jgi:hypothetical integral membrane protein (TIGR02206 family)